jgi:predicted dehydrogenase
MTALKLVVLGAGLMGREHCELMRKHPRAELAGVADPSPDAQNYAAGIGVPYFADYQQMLDETQPDGAIIAVPNTLHVSAGLACLTRGVRCLVEKPIADTIQSARELVDASEAAGVPVLVGHHRRHSPDIREAHRIVRKGILGDLVAVNGMCLSDKPDNYFEAEWRCEPGGGPLLINLIHEIDCLRFICGEVQSVRAFTSNAVRGFDVEDTASVALRFENGAVGTFLISDAVVSPYTWDIASGQALYFPHQPEDCYYFGGRKASLALPSMNLWRHAKGDEHWQHPLLRQHVALDGSRTYRNQLDHFLAVVSGAEDPVITARDGMMTLAATLAVATAAREDRTVTVEELLA